MWANFLMAWVCFGIQEVMARLVDFLYNLQTNVTVRRGIIWGISVHDVHLVDVSFLCVMYI